MKSNRHWLKSHSTPATLKWLEINYQPADGVCIPRNSLYKEYLEFSRLNQMKPVNAASFGKIIRQKFPTLTTRRLGTRGESKYHYYGLTVKLSSISYTRTDFNQNFDLLDTSNDSSATIRKLSVPPLPSRQIMSGLPPGKLRTNLETILDTYVSHCKRIADHALQFQLSQMCQEIDNFWKGFLCAFSPLLGNNSVLSLFGACDVILYHAISQNLFPYILWRGSLKSGEDGLIFDWEQALRLAENAVTWTSFSIEGGPESLKWLKISLARNFLQTIQSQSSLGTVCHDLLSVLESEDHLQKFIDDWNKIDVVTVTRGVAALRMNPNSVFEKDLERIILSSSYTFPESFKTLHARPGSNSSYSPDQIIRRLMSWSNKLTGDLLTLYSSLLCPSQNSSLEVLGNQFEKREIVEEAYRIWSSWGSSILRELSLNGASFYGGFERITLFLNKYAEHLLQSLMSSELIHRLLDNICSGNSIQELELYLRPVSQGYPLKNTNFFTPDENPGVSKMPLVATRSTSPTSRGSRVAAKGELSLLEIPVCHLNVPNSVSYRSGLNIDDVGGNDFFRNENLPQEIQTQPVLSKLYNSNFHTDPGETVKVELGTELMQYPMVQLRDQNEPIELMQIPMRTEGVQNILLLDGSVHQPETVDIENSSLATYRIESQIQDGSYGFDSNEQCYQVISEPGLPASYSITPAAMEDRIPDLIANVSYYNYYDQHSFGEQEYQLFSAQPLSTTSMGVVFLSSSD